MATPKKYFHDHFVLLLLSINAFLAIVGSIFIIISLTTGHSNAYIVQCRDCSNREFVNKYITGNVVDLLSFIFFAVLVFASNVMLSVRAYRINRQLAIAILSLGILLLVLTIIISNALLVLR